MPPKATGAKLTTLLPSDKELNGAKTILESARRKQRRSYLGSLSHFLKSNPDSKIEDLSKQEQLERLIVHQARCKDATTTIKSDKTISKNDAKFQDVHWWNRQKMIIEMGEIKAEHWIASKLLKPMPDSLTGSTEPELVEYPVPIKWQRMTEEEIKRLRLQSEAEADEEDTVALAAMLGEKTQAAPQAIKQEPESELSKLNRQIDTFKADPSVTLRLLQDMQLVHEKLSARASNVTDTNEKKFAAMLEADSKKLSRKLTKMIELVKRCCTEEADAKAYPKLLEQISEAQSTDKEVQGWANKFGYLTEEKARKRAKKQA